jgi:metal-responsive CopG/Arc/MetJ family transcriptional regulator
MSKEHETRISIRFPSDLAEELKKLAKAEDRSMNSEVVHAVRERIARKKEEQKREEGL